MIPDNILKRCILHSAFHLTEMEKAFIQLCMCRCFQIWKHTVDLHSHKSRIYHFVPGFARMNIKSSDFKHCLAGIKILVYNLIFTAAVCSIGIPGSKCRNIQFICAASHLFIRCKSNTYLSVRHGSLQQFFCNRHDLCDSGFVICPQKSGSIRSDQCSSLQLFQMRKGLNRKHLSAVSKRYILSIIISVYLRIYMFSAKIRSSIQMSDQADGRFVFISRGCRNRPVHITVFIHSDIFYSKFFHFLCKNLCKIKLASGAWRCIAVFVTCCVDFYIIQKSLICSHVILLF